MSNLIKVCDDKDFPVITSVEYTRIDLFDGRHGSSRYAINRQYLIKDCIGNSEHTHFIEPILLITSIKIPARYKQW